MFSVIAIVGLELILSNLIIYNEESEIDRQINESLKIIK